MDIKIAVAAHKPYWMPDDDMYLPVAAGANVNACAGYAPDNAGDNISDKNPHYCELTVLYWAWRNLQAEYLGLVHYRRHFSWKGAGGSKFQRVITREKLEGVLRKTDIVLPAPRNYFIETNYGQYVHAHHAADLDLTREILSERFPDCLSAFDKSMARAGGHRFNMFVMRRDLLNLYCQWLFDVLFELERRLDISAYSPYDARVFGFVGERLLDVWLETNRMAYAELPYVFLEKQNWLRKGGAFVLRKAGLRGL